MITLQVKKATTDLEKIIGLIGKKKPYPLLLQTRFGIHTFGVKFPIDLVILDNRYVVQNILKHMKPNRIFLWNPIYQYVLELPEGTIQAKDIKKGEKLKLMIQ